MSALYPNPPQAANKVVEGLQYFYSWTPRFPQLTSIQPNSSAAASYSTVGLQLSTPVFSTANPVTRLGRHVQQASAASPTDAGFYIAVNPAATAGFPIFFPGAANDAGMKFTAWVGIDSVCGSVALARTLSGPTAINGAPISGTAINAAAAIWIGLYNEGAGGGLRFGYKNSGGAITRLDSGEIPQTIYSAYQLWRLDFTFDPVGPFTYYQLAYMNAANTALVPVLNGRTSGFNPGRIPLSYAHCVNTGAAGNATDIFIASVELTGYPYGRLSK